MMAWYKRSEWTSSAQSCTAMLDLNRVKGVCIHYPGGNIPDAVAAGNKAATASWLRAVRSSQMASTKYDYCDIEYNLAVDRKGNVWDLRGQRLRGGANGTSTANEEYVSVLVIVGLTEKAKPTSAQVQGVRDAVKAVRMRYDGATAIKPHRAFVATACPGEPIMKLIRSGAFDPRVGVLKERRARLTAAIKELRAKLARKLKRREEVNAKLDELS